MRKTGRVTRADVAREAGVAESVVSNTLTGKRKVSEATRKRVLDAVEKLGYKPDTLAQALASGRSFQLGVLVPNLYNAYFAMVIMGVERVAVEKGYTVLVATTESRPGLEVVGAFLNSRVDACVLLTGGSDGIHDLLESNGTVYATCGFKALDADGRCRAPYVVPDFTGGARESVEHLVSLGHRRIALVPGDYDLKDDGSRLAGWISTLKVHGLTPEAVVPGNFTYDSGLTAFEEIMGSGATAVLVGNDYMAMGILDAARAAGVSVPDDLSVVGFDDIWQAKRLVPPLTTVDTSHEELGGVAARAVFAKLAGEPVTGTTVPVRLVARGSTGPVPGK